MKKLALLLLCLPLTANAMWGKGELKQESVCQVSEVEEMVDSCKDGDILLFTPSIFGNEQLPVNIAGYACNFEHPIVWNKGGVSCVFTTKRKESW